MREYYVRTIYSHAPVEKSRIKDWSVRRARSYITNDPCVFCFLILVLGHVLSPVRSLPRHSLLLIANYTSEHVCRLRSSAIFGPTFLLLSYFDETLCGLPGMARSRG